ncbi:3-keto-5-aminohexanoate cleavage protein [Rhizobium sp. RU36D]|uniref:3-keto-5-aminohexanoate cleavage protein n=1 Tax=Rhizobium sp. RU36D TaxID=1907415 RepID=UPI0015C44E63|nr:3-keto-5-aminohexanoate cleavage protein [Rhizobium sp. RU36D]
MRPALIMVAPNGARRDKADHPRLPITTEEIVETALECQAAGASALHLHIRDDKAAHSLDAPTYAMTLSRLSDVLAENYPIQITTEAAGRFEWQEQVGLVEALEPRFFSVSIAEIYRGGADAVSRLFLLASLRGLCPQIILYSVDDIALLARLAAAGTVDRATRFTLLLVVGRYQSGEDVSLQDFHALHQTLTQSGLSDGQNWMVCAFGRVETDILAAALELGGHARVGFENSLVNTSGALASSNAERVATIADLCRDRGRPIATPTQALEILGHSLASGTA